MRKLTLTLLFTILLATIVPAQRVIFSSESYNRVTLRSNFLGFVDVYDLHLPFGAEYRVDDRWSAGVDLGYIFHSEYFIENEGVSGWLVRPFARIYSRERPKCYFEARIYYKNVGYRTTDWIDRDIVDGNASYQEYATVTFRKRVMGLDLMSGRVLDLSRNGRLKMELYLGIGVRWKKQGVKDGRLSGRSFGFANYRAPEFVYPSLPFGARMTFAL